MNSQNNPLPKELNGTIRLGELFCGPGGIGLGATLACVNGLKFDHIWATDYDKDTCKTWRSSSHQHQGGRTGVRKPDKDQVRLERHGTGRTFGRQVCRGLHQEGIGQLPAQERRDIGRPAA